MYKCELIFFFNSSFSYYCLDKNLFCCSFHVSSDPGPPQPIQPGYPASTNLIIRISKSIQNSLGEFCIQIISNSPGSCLLIIHIVCSLFSIMISFEFVDLVLVTFNNTVGAKSEILLFKS